MKILLTGANGFVGSHILDCLIARGLPVTLLLRPESNRRFIETHLPHVEVRTGSVNEPRSLEAAIAGITHVIHCAGCIRAQPVSGFYAVNQAGTRNLVDVINAQQGRVRRLIHISSLAAAGPSGGPFGPVRQFEEPRPVSEYGKSKLAGESEVRNHCRAEHVILRPPAVYGPRDLGFFVMFQAVKRHVLPRPDAGQTLSLVFVQDLARVVTACLEHPAAGGKTYFVANSQIVTGRQMAAEIATQMRRWTVPLPLPSALLWPVCLGGELMARLTGKPRLLSLQKFAELRAPAWVCDASALERDLGLNCPTTLENGIAETLAWYRREGWL